MSWDFRLPASQSALAQKYPGLPWRVRISDARVQASAKFRFSAPPCPPEQHGAVDISTHRSVEMPIAAPVCRAIMITDQARRPSDSYPNPDGQSSGPRAVRHAQTRRDWPHGD